MSDEEEAEAQAKAPPDERLLARLAKAKAKKAENDRLRREGKLPSLKLARHIKEIEKRRRTLEGRLTSNATPRALFRQRMEREGKAKAIRQRRKEIAAKQPDLTAGAITKIIYEEFGYQGAKERDLYRQLAETLPAERRNQVNQASVKRYRMAKKLSKFDEAMAKLPANAPIEREYEWIQSHPAMGRKLLKEESDTSRVEITPADIEGAPSRSAVYKLMDYANRPQKFNDMLISEHKKRASGGGDNSDDDVAVVDDLAEVERMLKAASGD